MGMGEEWQDGRTNKNTCGCLRVSRTNPGTEAEPQQIVAQGYSHAYSTTFHLSRLQRI